MKFVARLARSLRSLWLSAHHCVARQRRLGGEPEAGRADLSRAAPGSIASFNRKMRDVVVDRDIFGTLQDAPALIEGWKRPTTTWRPHNPLNYHPPAPEPILAQRLVP